MIFSLLDHFTLLILFFTMTPNFKVTAGHFQATNIEGMATMFSLYGASTYINVAIILIRAYIGPTNLTLALD